MWLNGEYTGQLGCLLCLENVPLGNQGEFFVANLILQITQGIPFFLQQISQSMIASRSGCSFPREEFGPFLHQF
jgi:hypothetical protein